MKRGIGGVQGNLFVYLLKGFSSKSILLIMILQLNCSSLIINKIFLNFVSTSANSDNNKCLTDCNTYVSFNSKFSRTINTEVFIESVNNKLKLKTCVNKGGLSICYTIYNLYIHALRLSYCRVGSPLVFRALHSSSSA